MKMVTKVRAGVAVVAAILGSFGVAGNAQAASAPGTPTAPINLAALAQSAPVPISQAVAHRRSTNALQANASVADPSDCQAVTITSAANGDYVSAELGWSGDRYGTPAPAASA